MAKCGMARMVGNRYELAEQIGVGGMGMVYRVSDTQTGQIVAIKELNAALVEDNPEILERFTREGEIMRTLKHANIVRMLAMLEDEGKHYLVMEFVPGGSLADLLRQSIRLDLPAF